MLRFTSAVLIATCLVLGATRSLAKPNFGEEHEHGGLYGDHEHEAEHEPEGQHQGHHKHHLHNHGRSGGLDQLPATVGSFRGNEQGALAGILGGLNPFRAGVEEGKREERKEAVELVKDALEEKKVDELTNVMNWPKLLLNPIELIRAISLKFKLPLEKLVEKIGRGLVFGLEAALYPLMVSIKIAEKVFVPDSCKLKFMCTLGNKLEFLHPTTRKFSPNFLDLSQHVRALTEGIAGHACEAVFPCEPKLKRPFEELREGPKLGFLGARNINELPSGGLKQMTAAAESNKQATGLEAAAGSSPAAPGKQQ